MTAITENVLGELLDLLHSQAPKETFVLALEDWASHSAELATSKPVSWISNYFRLRASAHPYITTLFLLASIGNNHQSLIAGPSDTWLRKELKSREEHPAFVDAWHDVLHIRRASGWKEDYQASCLAECILAGATEPAAIPSYDFQVLAHGAADVRSLLATAESLGFPWHTVWADWRVKNEAARLPDTLNHG